MATRSLDHYEVLGVAPDATQDEIAARFRALARTLHPDARPAAPGAADEFKRITTAYRVLGDTARRQVYDRHRTAPLTITPVPTPPPVVRARPPRLTRRGARWAVIGGIAAIVSGVVATGLVVALQRHDAALRRDGVEATATVVDAGGGDRRLEFVGPDGELVQAPEPLKSGTGRPPLGSQVEIRYDPDDPTTVISSDSQLARDITLWIVAVKLLVGGLAFVVVGAHRPRRAEA